MFKGIIAFLSGVVQAFNAWARRDERRTERKAGRDEQERARLEKENEHAAEAAEARDDIRRDDDARDRVRKRFTRRDK